MRHLLATCALAALMSTVWSLPASAAGVGFSLPKFRMLTVEGGQSPDATSFGGSVQVAGTAFNVGPTLVDMGLDYAFTRDFTAAANYSFFDARLGVGVPLGFTPQFYLTPGLDAHGLLFVASPENLGTPTWGLGPRLTGGYRPTSNISVELGLSYTLLPTMGAAERTTGGGMLTVELGGTYRF